jgi:hypothetical protein
LNDWLVESDLCLGLQWDFAFKDVRMSSGDLAVLICSPCFDLAPERFSDLEVGSVKAFRLTMRAADGGESARFLSFYLAHVFSVSTATPLSAPPPLTPAVSQLLKIIVQ